jgi:hypothetical protein
LTVTVSRETFITKRKILQKQVKIPHQEDKQAINIARLLNTGTSKSNFI